MSRFSKAKLSVAGVIAMIILVAVIAGPGTQRTATTPGSTTPTVTSPAGSTPTSTVPNFGANGPSGAIGTNPGKGSTGTLSAAQQLALVRGETQGVDPQTTDPAAGGATLQSVRSHPLYQLLPLSKGTVTLAVGAFGDTQEPGVQVNYTGSLARAHALVAQVFAQHHDKEQRYQIRYSVGG
jgi:hypothetical protein